MIKTSSNRAMPFPSALPDGYSYLNEDVVFDPKEHLALEFPDKIWRLQDLGYTKAEVASCPTDFAVSSAARLLSPKGAKALLEVARSLREFAVGCERIQNMVRGGAYQSPFLRDLCLAPQVSEFLSDIYGIAVAPHTMPLHLGHINFAPDDLDKAVDKWHHDTLGLDYVLSVTDPSTLSGGEFQYFLGTKHEAAELAKQDLPIPEERIVSANFPGPGYMTVLHGFMVVHRGARLNVSGERITMVNGYVPLVVNGDDPCRFPDLKLVDPHHVLFPEWARHKAWLSQAKLNQLIGDIPFTEDRATLIAALKDAISDVEIAISDLSDESEGEMIHYGG